MMTIVMSQPQGSNDKGMIMRYDDMMPMCECRLLLPDSNLFQCMTLTFVDCHCKGNVATAVIKA